MTSSSRIGDCSRSKPSPAGRGLPRKIALRLKHKTKTASFLGRGGAEGTTIKRDEGPGGATIETGFDTLLRIIAADLSGSAQSWAVVKKIETMQRLFRRVQRLPGSVPMFSDQVIDHPANGRATHSIVRPRERPSLHRRS
jgi:hypothetical protein